jgi:hypothetical protein
MKKLRLNAEELRVEGFAPVDAATPRPGTVLGHDSTNQTRCVGNCTQDYSCGYPCP